MSQGPRRGTQDGQALVLLVGALCAVLVGAAVLGSVARALSTRAGQQRAADLAALAAARTMHGLQPRVLEPAQVDGVANPAHLPPAEYLRRARAAATGTARRNGARRVAVAFPDGGRAPARVLVAVRDGLRTPGGRVALSVEAEAELVPVADGGLGASGVGTYRGALATRQGQRMRPDVALAFDRLQAAARAAGLSLLIVSAFRSDAEQAVLWARNPDPRWVAPPGRSLHRLGTELDLGPPAAYGWLAANARRFGFLRRYAWEPWHFGFVRNPGTTSVGLGRGRAGAARGTPGPGGAVPGAPDGRRSGAVPGFVPEAYVALLQRAAQRWNVSAALLAAQLQVESGFDPRAVSPAGARGIAQFMPATAAAYGLRDPFDAAQAIDAQAHLMRDLLRRFATAPLALAAYNAGPGHVAPCTCVPPFPETQAYVRRVLALLSGVGDVLGLGGLEVRLVR